MDEIHRWNQQQTCNHFFFGDSAFTSIVIGFFKSIETYSRLLQSSACLFDPSDCCMKPLISPYEKFPLSNVTVFQVVPLYMTVFQCVFVVIC